MWSVLLFFGMLLLTSCAAGVPARRAVPAVVVELAFIRADDAARQSREIRGELRALWQGRAPPAPEAVEAVVRTPTARPPPPCVSRALCAWERRARAQALARLLVGVGS